MVLLTLLYDGDGDSDGGDEGVDDGDGDGEGIDESQALRGSSQVKLLSGFNQCTLIHFRKLQLIAKVEKHLLLSQQYFIMNTLENPKKII